MAIALDSAGSSQYANSTTLTYSHTTSGTNRILFVSASDLGGADKISGVTYAGVSMTLVGKKERTGTNVWVYLYVLHAPATGANNVVVSRSSSGDIQSGAVSYTGAKQTSTVDAHAEVLAASSASIAMTLTTIANNCWLTSVAHGALNQVVGANTTLRNNGNGIYHYDSNAAKAVAGSHSLNITWNEGGSSSCAYVIASFEPAEQPASGPANVKTFQGVAKVSVKTLQGIAIASVKSSQGVV